jgi:hypothetical protein
MAKKKTLDVPPFPPLRWDEYSWAGKITLPSWAGFKSRPDSPRSKKVSDGTVKVSVHVEDAEDDAPALPTAAQVAAMKHLLRSEKKTASAVLRTIFEVYPEAKAEYEEGYDEEPGTTLPEIKKPEGLRSLMCLKCVHVLYVEKDGVAYTGFDFGCLWEEEHGAGVMTHLSRVVEVGQADCSFLEWIAERDANRRKKKS